jgi:hypothetical protein
MKKIITIIAAFIMTAGVWAQSPEKMSYQAVVRNATNALITSQAVGMQLSILQGGATGTAVYVETQTPTTNTNGLVSLEIGSGTVVSGDFTTIDWANDTYFIKTETDPTGGTTYTITGTSQLMSVPYALHAKTAESVTGTISYTETDPVFGASVANGITAIDTANWNNHTNNTDTQLDSTGVTALGFVAGAHTVEIDGSVTNEIQTISRTGLTVSLSNGGGTYQDSINTYTAGTRIDITNNVISTVGCTYSVGDLVPALGGYIFYLDGSGCHGLVAKTQGEPSNYKWSATNFNTWAFASGIFGGAQNTKKSIARAVTNNSTCPAATQASLTDGGFNDWYLPSKDELDMMYVNLHLQGLGGFSDNDYWSSTEAGNLTAWVQSFGGGIQGDGNKGYVAYVRAVRAF